LDDVKTYLKDNPINYSVLVGEQEGLDAAKAFGVSSMAFPFSVLIDAKGNVITVHLGELHEDSLRRVLSVTEQLETGNISLQAARAAINTALQDASPAH
jgi:hypothetical protein